MNIVVFDESVAVDAVAKFAREFEEWTADVDVGSADCRSHEEGHKQGIAMSEREKSMRKSIRSRRGM